MGRSLLMAQLIAEKYTSDTFFFFIDFFYNVNLSLFTSPDQEIKVWQVSMSLLAPAGI